MKRLDWHGVEFLARIIVLPPTAPTNNSFKQSLFFICPEEGTDGGTNKIQEQEPHHAETKHTYTPSFDISYTFPMSQYEWTVELSRVYSLFCRIVCAFQNPAILQAPPSKKINFKFTILDMYYPLNMIGFLFSLLCIFRLLVYWWLFQMKHPIYSYWIQWFYITMSVTIR